MKLYTLIIVLFLSMLQSCSMMKSCYDNRNIKKVKKDTALINEVANMAVTMCNCKKYGNGSINVDSLPTIYAKKFKAVGNPDFIDISLNSKPAINLEGITDSVALIQIHNNLFLGEARILYNFSLKNRKFPVTKTKNYVLMKITDRIYYYRGQFYFPLS